MADYLKPLPRPSAESIPFWEGAKAHKLKIQECRSCEKSWFPPSMLCAHCGHTDHRWIDASGNGKIHSFVVFHRLYHKGWEGEVPYVVAIVELEEGPRLYANIVGIEPEHVRCEMEVKVVFDDVTDAVTIAKFTPV